MIKKSKYDLERLQLTKTKKCCLVLFSIVLIATSLVSFSVALDAPSSKADETNFIPAAPFEKQFDLNLAYAYVGPAPSDNSYFDEGYNATMYLENQYPSIAYLNITRVPGVQIASCDAIIEVYGIKIAANTGPAEYYSYGVGTDYNSSISNSDKITMSNHLDDLVDHNLYRAIVGNFKHNWAANTSILSFTIGSIGWYCTKPGGFGGLASAGLPSGISVTIYRIGYITISNGSVSIYKDSATINATASVQLDNYGDGFLFNKLVPAEKLSETNLFEPSHS